MARELSFAAPHSVRFAICSVLTSMLITTAGCESPTEAGHGLAGEWEGYIGLSLTVPPVVKGDFTVTILKSLDCDCSGSMSGFFSGWNDFVLTFTGSPGIDSNHLINGEMTVTRYRAGVDTLVATAWISGSFIGDLGDPNISVTGLWGTVNGSPFMADGRWGAYKN